MKYEIYNLGPIKRAKFELGDMTIICGENNNGKTYLTYTLTSFLDTIDKNLEVPMAPAQLRELLSRGEIIIDLKDYLKLFLEEVERTMPRFANTLSRFLAMHPDRFSSFEFNVQMTKKEVLSHLLEKPSDGRNATHITDVRLSEKLRVRCAREYGSTSVRVSLISKASLFPSEASIGSAVAFSIARLFDEGAIGKLFPKVFVITCERTGVALFRSEIASSMAKAYDKFGNKIRFLYQRPIEKDAEFVLNLSEIVRKKSVIAENNPEIIKSFNDIVGGKYFLDQETKTIKFMPKGGDETLSMAESSSTIRSLSELYFYLSHVARPGHLFVFDEPELNLHPRNQRLLARLLVKMMNAGIRVLINTHSDYIVREINILLTICSIKSADQGAMLAKYGFGRDMYISSDRVRAYILKNGHLKDVLSGEDEIFAFKSFDDTLSDYARLFVAISDEKRRIAEADSDGE